MKGNTMGKIYTYRPCVFYRTDTELDSDTGGLNYFAPDLPLIFRGPPLGADPRSATIPDVVIQWLLTKTRPINKLIKIKVKIDAHHKKRYLASRPPF